MIRLSLPFFAVLLCPPTVIHAQNPDLVIADVRFAIVQKPQPPPAPGEPRRAERPGPVESRFLLLITNGGTTFFPDTFGISWGIVDSEIVRNPGFIRCNDEGNIIMPGEVYPVEIRTAMKFDPGTMVRFTIERPDKSGLPQRFEESDYKNNTAEYLFSSLKEGKQP
jgi:hypothetical protein